MFAVGFLLLKMFNRCGGWGFAPSCHHLLSCQLLASQHLTHPTLGLRRPFASLAQPYSTIGGKQGDLLFPDLFNLHFCAIMQIWRQRRVGADVGLRLRGVIPIIGGHPSTSTTTAADAFDGGDVQIRSVMPTRHRHRLLLQFTGNLMESHH